MQELYNKILTESVVLNPDTLKVDSFLNHQIDPAFILKIGGEIADRFIKDSLTKILTVESSGIAVALAAGLSLGIPVVFAKKKRPDANIESVYSSNIFSFARQEETRITVDKSYLGPQDTVLIVDDFLAHGEALQGLVAIVRQAGAKLAGAGIVIEKTFQQGGTKLRSEGIRIESLASIESMEPGVIRFS